MPEINLDAMNLEFKKYYLDHKQNKSNLVNKLLGRTDTEEFFDDRRTIVDDVTEMGFTAQSVHVQQWSENFTPTGELKLEVEQAQVQKLKIDVQCVPDKLESSWYAFLIDVMKQDPKDYPFTPWWLEQQVIPAWKESWESSEIYKGVKVSVIPAGGTIEGTAVNGIEKIFKNGIAAGKITPHIMGAPPAFGSANADKEYCEYLEAFIYGIPEKVRKKLKREVMIDINRIDMYENGRLEKYGDKINAMNIDVSAPAVSKIGKTDFYVKGVDSMEGKNRIFTTRVGNAYLITRRPQQAGFRLLPVDYETVKATSKWSKAFGFWYLPWVETNDVD